MPFRDPSERGPLPLSVPLPPHYCTRARAADSLAPTFSSKTALHKIYRKDHITASNPVLDDDAKPPPRSSVVYQRRLRMAIRMRMSDRTSYRDQPYPGGELFSYYPLAPIGCAVAVAPQTENPAPSLSPTADRVDGGGHDHQSEIQECACGSTSGYEAPCASRTTAVIRSNGSPIASPRSDLNTASSSSPSVIDSTVVRWADVLALLSQSRAASPLPSSAVATIAPLASGIFMGVPAGLARSPTNPSSPLACSSSGLSAPTLTRWQAAPTRAPVIMWPPTTTSPPPAPGVAVAVGGRGGVGGGGGAIYPYRTRPADCTFSWASPTSFSSTSLWTRVSQLKAKTPIVRAPSPSKSIPQPHSNS